MLVPYLLPFLAAATFAAPLEERASNQAQKIPLGVLKSIGYRSPQTVETVAAATSGSVLAGPTACTTDCNSTLSFAGAQAATYQVGNQLPGIPFKTRTSWAGEVPLNPVAGASLDSYFFWMFGYEGGDAKTPSDSIVFWIQGGPGCDSLSGLLQEVGPITYNYKGDTPTPNNYSWTLAADMVFPEQPLGVGFDNGIPTAYDENDVGVAFGAFLDSFFSIFPELKAKKLYIAAESYGGRYGPYISNYLIDQGSKYNFHGLLVVDGVVTDILLQEDVVTYQFVEANKEILKFTDADVETIRKDAESCGYIDYVNDNLKYPPKGKLPPYNEDGCNTFNDYYNIASSKNPAFNIYKVDDTAHPPNVLGDANSPTQFLNRTFYDNYDLQNYIHAPHKKWNVCNQGVFPNGDHSPAPDTNGVLQKVIEKSPAQRTVIINGQKDGLIISNGTSLALQNLTWNGGQGFSKSPFATTLINSDGDASGWYTKERGLLYALVEKAGHEVPEYDPPAGFKLVQYLLGQTTL
ncbi:alpha/beta-hydrolase [Tilletiaria anomala UBC 951]|uniref:Carboxypeptidase n=1 Tax=Tilletiaria anomala (strain ATCC 24038 / CBS 436.72 / UBC 951) TaxID=1037660 RepID=A0A066WI44_TILAU|nr:alpha/beta-hydrolase [Tilletiaria anomala UBC 951]KDN53496.1 alpha/beta-hydrolase [Tilletiaria anomala UBC 951]